MTRLPVVPILVAALAGIAINAQGPAPGAIPSFDAVSIKPNGSGGARRAFRIEPGGNVTASNITVRHLMWHAYQVHDFAIDLEWSPELQADTGQAVQGAAAARPSLFAAVREQLGLRLEPRTGPVDVIVIESIERLSEN